MKPYSAEEKAYLVDKLESRSSILPFIIHHDTCRCFSCQRSYLAAMGAL